MSRCGEFFDFLIVEPPAQEDNLSAGSGNPLRAACAHYGIAHAKRATVEKLRACLRRHWYQCAPFEPVTSTDAPAQTSQDSVQQAEVPVHPAASVPPVPLLSSRPGPPAPVSALSIPGDIIEADLDTDDNALVCQYDIGDGAAEEALGSFDIGGLEDAGLDEDDEEDGSLDLDDDAPDTYDKFRRDTRVSAAQRTEGNRRAGGKKTQKCVVKSWNVFQRQAIDKGEMRDNVVDEHALLLFLKFSAARCARNRRGEDKPGTRIGASQIKKEFFGALRIRKVQDARDPTLATRRPATSVYVYDFLKTIMDQALKNSHQGLIAGEDAPDIVANTFLAQLSDTTLDKIGYGFLDHRELKATINGHLSWCMMNASGNRGDDIRALRLCEMQPYTFLHPNGVTEVPSVLSLQSEQKATRRGMKTTVNPTYTCFIAHRDPVKCPLGAFALYLHFIHDHAKIDEKYSLDYTSNKSWRSMSTFHPLLNETALQNLFCMSYKKAGVQSRLKAHLARHMLGYHQEKMGVDANETSKLGWSRDTYSNTYAPALPKAAILGAHGFRVHEEYNPTWTQVEVPKPFLDLICPMAEANVKLIEGKQNLVGATNYWQMVIALRPRLFQCAAAIYQVRPNSSIFRLPALARSDVKLWMATEYPVQLAKLSAAAGEPVDLARIENAILRRALEEIQHHSNRQGRRLEDQTQLLSSIYAKLDRRTAQWTPLRAPACQELSSQPQNPLRVTAVARRLSFDDGGLSRLPQPTSPCLPSTLQPAPIIDSETRASEDAGVYEAADHTLRGYIAPSPRAIDQHRPRTDVDLVLPPLVAFYAPGEAMLPLPPMLGQGSAQWTVIFAKIKQFEALWETWKPSKTLDQMSVQGVWDCYNTGEAIFGADGVPAGMKPPLRLVEQHFKSDWRRGPAARKFWQRFREIPEWIDASIKDRRISTTEALAELEGMRSVPGRAGLLGTSALSETLLADRRKAAAKTILAPELPSLPHPHLLPIFPSSPSQSLPSQKRRAPTVGGRRKQKKARTQALAFLNALATPNTNTTRHPEHQYPTLSSSPKPKSEPPKPQPHEMKGRATSNRRVVVVVVSMMMRAGAYAAEARRDADAACDRRGAASASERVTSANRNGRGRRDSSASPAPGAKDPDIEMQESTPKPTKKLQRTTSGRVPVSADRNIAMKSSDSTAPKLGRTRSRLTGSADEDIAMKSSGSTAPKLGRTRSGTSEQARTKPLASTRSAKVAGTVQNSEIPPVTVQNDNMPATDLHTSGRSRPEHCKESLAPASNKRGRDEETNGGPSQSRKTLVMTDTYEVRQLKAKIASATSAETAANEARQIAEDMMTKSTEQTKTLLEEIERQKSEIEALHRDLEAEREISSTALSTLDTASPQLLNTQETLLSQAATISSLEEHLLTIQNNYDTHCEASVEQVGNLQGCVQRHAMKIKEMQKLLTITGEKLRFTKLALEAVTITLRVNLADKERLDDQIHTLATLLQAEHATVQQLREEQDVTQTLVQHDDLMMQDLADIEQERDDTRKAAQDAALELESSQFGFQNCMDEVERVHRDEILAAKAQHDAALAAATTTVRTLQSRLKDAEEALKDSKEVRLQQIEGTRAQVESDAEKRCKDSEQRFQAHLSAIESQLHEARLAKGSAEKDLQASKQEYDQRLRNVETKRDQVISETEKKHQKSLRDLHGRLQDLDKASKTASEKAKNLEDSLQGAQNRLKLATQTDSARQSKILQIEGERNAAVADATKAKNECAILSRETESLRSDLQSLRDAAENLIMERDHANYRIQVNPLINYQITYSLTGQTLEDRIEEFETKVNIDQEEADDEMDLDDDASMTPRARGKKRATYHQAGSFDPLRCAPHSLLKQDELPQFQPATSRATSHATSRASSHATSRASSQSIYQTFTSRHTTPRTSASRNTTPRPSASRQPTPGPSAASRQPAPGPSQSAGYNHPGASNPSPSRLSTPWTRRDVPKAPYGSRLLSTPHHPATRLNGPTPSQLRQSPSQSPLHERDTTVRIPPPQRPPPAHTRASQPPLTPRRPPAEDQTTAQEGEESDDSLADMEDIRRELRAMRRRFPGHSQSERARHAPYTLPANLRPQSPQRTLMMNIARNEVLALLGISKDEDAEQLTATKIVDPAHVEAWLEDDDVDPPNIENPLIHFDEPKSFWNLELSWQFAQRIVDRYGEPYPFLKGTNDEEAEDMLRDVAAYFIKKVYNIRKVLLRRAPLSEESDNEHIRRVDGRLKNTEKKNRRRNRQRGLRQVRREICLGEGRETDPSWNQLLNVVETLGDDGQSSDYSDGPDYKVKVQEWRHPDVGRLLQFIDSHRWTTNASGNKRPGAQPRRRSSSTSAPSGGIFVVSCGVEHPASIPPDSPLLTTHHHLLPSTPQTSYTATSTPLGLHHSPPTLPRTPLNPECECAAECCPLPNTTHHHLPTVIDTPSEPVSARHPTPPTTTFPPSLTPLPDPCTPIGSMSALLGSAFVVSGAVEHPVATRHPPASLCHLPPLTPPRAPLSPLPLTSSINVLIGLSIVEPPTATFGTASYRRGDC
ncbi:hypothetical protein D9615_010341 [Tricholomella constricta]|uniref:Uncharacterized protein n=1 Tax=Tricholomella constricta TaxID=117010 RepID=A0A8H5LUY0_9AGAR|nr:hypothetical protein D9615_010341 [Tricholomella constricta]